MNVEIERLVKSVRDIKEELVTDTIEREYIERKIKSNISMLTVLERELEEKIEEDYNTIVRNTKAFNRTKFKRDHTRILTKEEYLTELDRRTRN